MEPEPLLRMVVDGILQRIHEHLGIRLDIMTQ
jgi:hypothetical protein